MKLPGGIAVGQVSKRAFPNLVVEAVCTETLELVGPGGLG